MQNWLNMMKKMVDYLFPSKDFLGKKITDKSWVNVFIPIAPYTAIFMCGVLIYLGIVPKSPRPFLLIPQGFIATLATFWTLILFIVSQIIKKKHRSPAVPLFIANVIPVQAFLGLLLFIGFQSSAQKKFEPQHQQISQTVRDKIEEKRFFIAQKFQETKTTVEEHQEDVQKSIDKMKEFQSGAFERFRQTGREIDQYFAKAVAKSDQRWSEALTTFNNNRDEARDKREMEWEESRQQRLKTRTPLLGEKIEKTSVAEDVPSTE